MALQIASLPAHFHWQKMKSEKKPKKSHLCPLESMLMVTNVANTLLAHPTLCQETTRW